MQTKAVPCGKCPECQKRIVSGWSFRLMQEYKRSTSGYFITLTFDTNHVPITRAGYMSLNKKILQDFFKRLRKSHEDGSGESIKYYAVGEYGGSTNRPHYHIILFNAKIEKVSPAWGLGNVHYGSINEASVGYTLKYINKKSKIPCHRNDDRIPQFALMSKKLGDNYLSETNVNWHHADLHNRMHCTLQDGKKIAMPRYYKDKIYHPTQRKAIGYYQQNKMEDELVKKYNETKGEYFNDQKNNAIAAFRKQKLQSQKRDKL